MKRRFVVFVAVLMLALSVADAQLNKAHDIKIWVNGVKFNFTGAKPKSILDHLMIPLHGVVEEIGATVDWDDVTNTAKIVKGKTVVEILVGTDIAKVNGEDTQMEMSARLSDGSVYIPLRFIVETLGAELTWNAATETVKIHYSGDAGASENSPPPVAATGLSSSESGYVGAGFPIDYTMRGAPNGVGRLWIPGVAGPTSLKESAPGIYTGTWLAPPAAGTNPITLQGATAIGSVRVGGSESFVQVGGSTFIDTAPPEVTLVTPYNGIRWVTPTPVVVMEFDDGAGSGVDVGNVFLQLDGQDITLQAQISVNGLRYTPEESLSVGVHSLAVKVSDKAGNSVNRNFNFYVGSPVPSIDGLLVEAPPIAEPGSKITFALNGVTGGTATCSIGRIRTDIKLVEVDTGVYRGEYTVQEDDDFLNQPVIATLRSNYGDEFAVTSETLVSTTRNFGPLTLTSPTPGNPLEDPLVIRGVAFAGRKVRLHVDYSTALGGASPFTGAMADFQVVADETGAFESPPIDLGTLPLGNPAQIKVSAALVGADGRKSSPQTVTIKLNPPGK